MTELPRPHVLALLAVGAVVVVLGALWLRRGVDDGAAGAAGAAAARPVQVRGGGAGGRGGASVVVHVAGAVRRPGLYRLPAGTRVGGAVRRAGGATRGADLDAVNLAARVEDGRQVLVPRRAAVSGPAGAATAAAGGAAATGTAAGPPTAAAAPGVPAVPINLNTATLEQLDTLQGIGPATATAILAYRQEHGGFASVDELDAVPGIGPATLEALRDAVTV